MKCVGPTLAQGDLTRIRKELEFAPDIEELAELLSLAGNSTRLKLLYLLSELKELCVCDLAELLGVSMSAASQHLAKLRAHGLVVARRDAQTLYYRLADHAFTRKLARQFFRDFETLASAAREGSPRRDRG